MVFLHSFYLCNEQFFDKMDHQLNLSTQTEEGIVCIYKIKKKNEKQYILIKPIIFFNDREILDKLLF